MLTVQIEGSENLLGSLNRVKLFTISLGFRKDIVRNIHFVFLYPSQRHNWPPSLEIISSKISKISISNFHNLCPWPYLWLTKVVCDAFQNVDFVLVTLLLVLHSAGDHFHWLSSLFLLWRIRQSLFCAFKENITMLYFFKIWIGKSIRK